MDHEVTRWPGLSWSNCTLKKTEANDWLRLAHIHTHRAIGPSATKPRALCCCFATMQLLWGESATTASRDSSCLSCTARLSRHYTHCHLLWVIGEKMLVAIWWNHPWLQRFGLLGPGSSLAWWKPEKLYPGLAAAAVAWAGGTGIRSLFMFPVLM